ncbi:MAG TPA: sulfite exporter TauE/SafE family protein [Gemmatimonadales bacterium]|nr:sulfite exporter TauE/SafE family protein [Gemmatimonadales bacterium]
MSTLLPAILVASLLGSPHCAAMCGGFVCFYSGQGGTSRAAHFAYNSGRLVSYLLLGILAGTLGAGIDVAGRMAGLQRGAAVAAGFVMIAWGGATVATSLGLRLPGSVAPAGFRRLLARALELLHDRPPAQRALAIGLLTTLLPCGWLYVFVAAAAGTGSPLDGALVMTAFWAGTVPIMAGLGLASQRALGALGLRMRAITAAVLMVLGLLTVTGRIRPELHHDATPPAFHDTH